MAFFASIIDSIDSIIIHDNVISFYDVRCESNRIISIIFNLKGFKNNYFA